MFTQKSRFSHYLVTLLLISGTRFCNPQNSSGASQQNGDLSNMEIWISGPPIMPSDLYRALCFKTGPCLLQLSKRMLERGFNINLQKCSVSYQTLPDAISTRVKTFSKSLITGHLVKIFCHRNFTGKL